MTAFPANLFLSYCPRYYRSFLLIWFFFFSPRDFLTTETVHQYTKRTIREKLAAVLNVSIQTVNTYKAEINTIIDKVVAEIAGL